jgi:anti-anti-sigma factor
MNLGDVQISLEGGVVLVHVSGEIDLSNAAGIEQAIVVATPNHAELVLLDLSRVDYLDSAGIHLVYRLREKIHGRGQGLKLVMEDRSSAADALELAGVMEHFEIRTSVEAALE